MTKEEIVKGILKVVILDKEKYDNETLKRIVTFYIEIAFILGEKSGMKEIVDSLEN